MSSTTLGLTPQSFFQIMTRGLQEWVRASHQGFSFTYYQGSDHNLYPTSLGAAPENEVYFTSQSSEKLSCNLAALTMVWFDVNSGLTQRTALRFNDDCQEFSTNPKDTGATGKIYLGDAATHELGHVLGLDHSQNLQSTMNFMIAPEMSQPSCDDLAGISPHYSFAQNSTGSIEGAVLNGDQPIFGAHVSAISFERGVAMASALTDKDGTFDLPGLEPGHYALLAEPYYPGTGSLGPYYAGIHSQVCNGGMAFQRTFLTSGRTLVSIPVGAGMKSPSSSISVSCAPPASLNGRLETSSSSAPVLATGPIFQPIATQSVFTGGPTTHYYRLNQQQGFIQASALGYSLYSPIGLKVQILTSSGSALNGALSSPMYISPSSMYVNYDGYASANLTSAQDILISVTVPYGLTANLFPGNALAMSATPYYALAISGGTTGQPIYAQNARCEDQRALAAYPNQGPAPAIPPAGGSTGNNGSHGFFGCGRVERSSGPRGHDSASFAGLINFAGLALLLALARRRWMLPTG